MSHPDQPDTSDSKSDQDQPSFDDTIERANRAIDELRAEIARSQVVGQSIADLTRELGQAIEEENDDSRVQKKGT